MELRKDVIIAREDQALLGRVTSPPCVRAAHEIARDIADPVVLSETYVHRIPFHGAPCGACYRRGVLFKDDIRQP
jgi:hypothetical protein